MIRRKICRTVDILYWSGISCQFDSSVSLLAATGSEETRKRDESQTELYSILEFVIWHGQNRLLYFFVMFTL
jgi:hypothetical protein